MLITDFNSSNIEYINTLTIDFSGRLVVAGKANDMFALARYTTDGKPDKSFDNDGKVTTNFTSADFEEINGITIDSHDSNYYCWLCRCVKHLIATNLQSKHSRVHFTNTVIGLAMQTNRKP